MSVEYLKNGIRLYKGDSVERLKESALIAKEVLAYAVQYCEIGTTTEELEREIESRILAAGGLPAFKGYEGFPYSACISVNEYIVHGIPTSRKLQDGDIVSIDLGVIYKGFYSDTARTKILGTPQGRDKDLVDTAEEAFHNALKVAHVGNTIGDIGHSIHKTVIKHTNDTGKYVFDIYHNFQGHGIGLQLHEQPSVPNFGFPNGDRPLVEGMCICIEPVLIYRGSTVIEEPIENGYVQFKSLEGLRSTHYENQVYISHSGPIVLT